MEMVDGPRERKATSGGESSKAQTELSERDFTRWAQTGLDLDEWKAQEEQRKRRIEEKAAAAAASGGAPAENKGGRKSAGGGGGGEEKPAKKAKK